MPIEDKNIIGYVESYAPEAQSDEIRLALVGESIARMTAQIEGIGKNLDQLESDYAARVISIEKFEQTGRELDAALMRAAAKLALFEAQKQRIEQLFSNC